MFWRRKKEDKLDIYKERENERMCLEKYINRRRCLICGSEIHEVYQWEGVCPKCGARLKYDPYINKWEKY